MVPVVLAGLGAGGLVQHHQDDEGDGGNGQNAESGHVEGVRSGSTLLVKLRCFQFEANCSSDALII